MLSGGSVQGTLDDWQRLTVGRYADCALRLLDDGLETPQLGIV